MLLEDVQITNAILDKLRPDQLSRRMPQIPIRCKNRVAEEIFPLSMKRLSLAIVCKLSCENSFDVLWVSCEDASTTDEGAFGGISHAFWRCEEAGPCFKVFVLHGGFDAEIYDINTCEMC